MVRLRQAAARNVSSYNGPKPYRIRSHLGYDGTGVYMDVGPVPLLTRSSMMDDFGGLDDVYKPMNRHAPT